jgi:pimeloyl-ACP methyl ester carboxylesterase
MDSRARLMTAMAVTERRLDAAGIPTAVVEQGAGPPVVLLHGAGECVGVWAHTLRELAARHRVVAADLPGHGGSGLGAEALDRDRVVAWLADLIARTCDRPPAVVGHGIGGAIAATAAAGGVPVDRLVLEDSTGLAPFDPAPSFGEALQRYTTEPTEGSRDALFLQCFVDVDRVRSRMGDVWGPLGAHVLERAQSPAARAALDVLVPAFALAAIPDADLAHITVPTTLVWGRDDLMVRLAVAQAASDRQGWPLHVIDGAGDDPAMEQPEAFLRALDAALTGSAVVGHG